MFEPFGAMITKRVEHSKNICFKSETQQQHIRIAMNFQTKCNDLKIVKILAVANKNKILHDTNIKRNMCLIGFI